MIQVLFTCYMDYNDAVFAVYKPLGWTSFDICNLVKRSLHIKKVGHCGTLDPLAEGVVVIATGKKTKQIPIIQERIEKVYEAEICFGATTKTLDTEEFPLIFQDTSYITHDVVESVIKSHFLGSIIQTPPLFSALKVNGKPLYSIARSKKDYSQEEIKHMLEKKTRTITITDIQNIIVSYVSPEQVPHNAYLLKRESERDGCIQKSNAEKQTVLTNTNPSVSLAVCSCTISCSTGTYIRSLARDIAQKCDTTGYLLALKRINDYGYTIDECISVDDIRNSK